MARRFTSIAIKNGIVYILIMLLACLALSVIFFVSSKEIILDNSEAQIDHIHDILQKEFENYIVDIENDVRYLSNNPFVEKAALSNWEDEILEPLSDELLAFLASKRDYNQVRIIGIDEDGKEIIRAERNNGQPLLIPESDLQSKGRRNYFIEAMEMAEMYFSEIDLNREMDTISYPLMPTMRAAAQIKVEDRSVGLIVINLDLRRFLEKVNDFVGPGQSLYLISNRSEFILHPDKSQTFGFDFERPDLAVDMSNELGAFENGSAKIEKQNIIYFSRQWPYPRGGYDLVCTFAVANEALLIPVWNWQAQNLLYILIVVIGFGIFALILMSRQGRQLEKITTSMISYGEGKMLGQLPVKRNDEIGEMARSFQRMAEAIEAHIQEVQNERDKAIKANRSKEEFLENMSHEIRNPLQSTIGMLDVLFQNDPTPEQAKILRSMKFSAGQLKTLVDDILDYSKLKEGVIKLKPQPLILSDLLNNICNSHSYEAALNQVKIEAHLDPKLIGQFYNLDAGRFTQVLSNLISNAIKFSHKKGVIDVKVSLIHRSEDKDSLRFIVRDYGIGMSDEELDRIGDRFYRGATDISSLDGNGLGLPVVFEILKLFDSQIQFDSQPQKGTLVQFDLSLVKKGQLPEKEKAENKKDFSLYSGIQKVLCLDDDVQVRLFFEHIFAGPKYDLTLIGYIEEWEEVSSSGQAFDLIVSDVRLHTLKMTSKVEKLRRLLSDNGVLIFMSGQPLDEDINVPWLIKPMKIGDISETWFNEWYKAISAPPDFQSFYVDYDHDIEMVDRALRLLDKEWDLTTGRLLMALKAGDANEFGSAYHKLTTTLKRLNLLKLDSALHVLNDVLEKDTQISRTEYQVFADCFFDIRAAIKAELDGLQKV